MPGSILNDGSRSVDVELNAVAGLAVVLLDELAEAVEPRRLVDHHRDRRDARLRERGQRMREGKRGQAAGNASQETAAQGVGHRFVLVCRGCAISDGLAMIAQPSHLARL